MGQGDVGHDAPRETAPIIAMAIVGYVRDALGRAAVGDVARVLGPATCVNDVLDDPNRWYSIDEVLAMASLARELRSEEHTSELQSLMRISYAVFCLKKKKRTKQIIKTNRRTILR